MRRHLAALLFLTACTATITSSRSPAPSHAAQGSAPAAGPSFAYVNGQWFNGERFERRTMYSTSGVFTERAPAVVDSTIDLGNGYVVPPFGDAHTHNLDGPFNLDTIRATYIREGTFYVQVLTNVASRTAAIRSRFNRPCDLDVAYANGGLTSTLSHPFLAYEPRAMTSLPPGADWNTHAAEIRVSRIRGGDAYWFLDSIADLDSAWPKILAARPDVIKIFLLDAMEAPPAPSDTGLPSGHGLRPSLVPQIVRRAHAAGLRVAAHIETANDARIAVEAGVDILAHLPGYLMGEHDDVHRFEIDDATARLAGARGVVATPTLSWANLPGSGTTPAAASARLTLQGRNIRLLRAAGVRIVVGSDMFGRTATPEFEAFAATGIWSPAELLTLWSTATSRAIFPSRRIGILEPGYDASFLVLSRDPLQSLDAVKDIRLRVKQGCILAG